MGPRVAVIDYGMGNVWSVISALRYLSATVELVRDPEVLTRQTSGSAAGKERET